MGAVAWIIGVILAGALAGPIGGIAVVGMWVLAVMVPGQRREREVAAAVVELDNGGEGYSSDWTFDLTGMTAVWRGGPDDDTHDTVKHKVKRSEKGRWYTRLTEQQRDAELSEIAEDEKGERADFMRRDRDERKAKVYANEWERLDGHLESQVELAYQRFVKTPSA